MYRAPIRELRFVLDELLGVGSCAPTQSLRITPRRPQSRY